MVIVQHSDIFTVHKFKDYLTPVFFFVFLASTDPRLAEIAFRFLWPLALSDPYYLDGRDTLMRCLGLDSATNNKRDAVVMTPPPRLGLRQEQVHRHVLINGIYMGRI